MSTDVLRRVNFYTHTHALADALADLRLSGSRMCPPRVVCPCVLTRHRLNTPLSLWSPGIRALLTTLHPTVKDTIRPASRILSFFLVLLAPRTTRVIMKVTVMPFLPVLKSEFSMLRVNLTRAWTLLAVVAASLLSAGELK